MVKFRLKRMGKKFDAFYRVVVTDVKSPRDSGFIDEIGYYNPHSKEMFLKTELVTKWKAEGAKPTDTVKTLFKKYAAAGGEGVVKLASKPKKKKAKTVKAE